jgi:putative transcriptional regulator
MESTLDMLGLTSYLSILSSLLHILRNDIRTLRTANELSQQQLAQAMDVSRQTINSIEKERYTPSLPLAIALARYFGKPVEEIFHADP